MSSKIWSLGVLGFTLVLCFSGCKSCGSGQDPLLGKTRVDPPTTNARSVYVERQNVNECGVVPGGGCATSCTSPEIPASSNPTGIIQPGAGSVQTVYYPNGLDSEEVPVSTSTASQEEKTSENSHLHWLSTEVPQNNVPRGPSLSDLGTRDLTEEELANYRYVYDFSVMPPRKVPVGRSAEPVGRSADVAGYSAGLVSTGKPASGIAPVQGASPDPYIPQTAQFVSQNFDPYAPNRQFERRKAKLSRTFATEFDEAEPNSASVQIANSTPYSASVQTANSTSERNETTHEPAQVAQAQISAKDSGWRVVAAPDPASSPSAAPLSREAVADSQAAPVHQAVGSKAQVPGKVSENDCGEAPQKVSAPERASDNSRQNSHENSRENSRENFPQSSKMNDDSAVDLFDLPRK